MAIEITEKREINVKHFSGSDGLTAKVFPYPIHYDKNGTLEDIDINFHTNTVANPAYYKYITKNNTFLLGLAEDLSVPKAFKYTLRYDGFGEIYETITGLALYDASTGQKVMVDTPKPAIAQVDGSVATYDGIFPGVKYEIHSRPDKVKTYITISDRSYLPDPMALGLNPLTTYVVVLNKYESNLEIRRNDDEEIELIDNEGTKKVYSPKEWAKDNHNYYLRIVNSYDSITNEYLFGIHYEDVVSSSLPITIDPTWTSAKVEISNSSEDWYFSKRREDYLFAEACNNTSLRVGTHYYHDGCDEWFIKDRTALIFPINNVSLPKYQSARLMLNKASGTLGTVQVAIMLNNWLRTSKVNGGENGDHLVVFNNIGSATLINNVNATPVSGSWYQTDITQAVKKWLTKENPNYGLGLRRNPESNSTSDVVEFSSMNSGVSTAPYIEVTYTYASGVATTSQITWSWTKPVNYHYVEIYDGATLKRTETNPTNQWIEVELNNNTTYSRTFKYFNSSNVLLAQETVSASTHSQLLAPVSISGTANTWDKITWSWTKNSSNSGITGFQLIDKSADGYERIVATINNPSATSYQETGLRAGQTYKRAIREIKGDATDGLSIESSNVTTQTLPGGQTLTPIVSEDTYINSNDPNANYGSVGNFYSNTASSILLKFNLSDIQTQLNNGYYLDASSVNIYVGTFGGGTATVCTVSSNWSENTVTYNTRPSYYAAGIISKALNGGWNSFNIKELVQLWLQGLEPNYGVIITNNTSSWSLVNSREYPGGTGSPYLSASLLPLLPPSSQPTGLTGTVYSSTSVNWVWNAVSGASGYRLYDSHNEVVGITSSTSFTETGMTTDVSATRYVVAFNQYGESIPSSTATKTPITPSAPATLTGTVSNNSIAWNWGSVSDYGVAAYELCETFGDGYVRVIYTTPNATTFTYTENNLRYNKGYVRSVRAVRGSEKGAFRQSTTYTTSAYNTTSTISVQPDNNTGIDMYVYDSGTINNNSQLRASEEPDLGFDAIFIKIPFSYAPPTGSTFSNAKIKLRTNGVGNGADLVYSKITSSWSSESVIPTYSFTTLGSVTIPSATSNWYDFDIPSNIFQEWLTPATNNGIRIWTYTSYQEIEFYSSDETNPSYTQYRPKLEFTYDLAPILSAPATFQGQVLSASSIKWTWSQVAGAANYRIYDQYNNLKHTTASGSTTEWTQTGLTSGEYKYYIVSVNAPGIESTIGSDITTVDISIPPTPTYPVQPLTLINPTASTVDVQFTWIDLTASETHYVVRWQIDNGVWNEVVLATASPYSYTIPSVSWGSLVKAYVIARNGIGDSAPAETKQIVALVATSKIGGNPQDTTSIMWRWKPVAGATAYTIKDISNNILQDNVAGTTWTQSGLVTNTNYQIKVFAKNANGSADSNYGTTSTAIKTLVIPPVTTLTGTPEGYDKIRWTWS